MTISCGSVDVVAVGSISISSTPIGPTVELAPSVGGVPGTYVNQGVVTSITNVPVGDYFIRLTLTNYNIYITSLFTVSANTNTPITATLTLTATPADIRAFDMTISPSNPCIQGACVVTVTVRWRNYGETTGSFTPSIVVDGVPPGTIDETYTSESLAGLTTSASKVFTVRGLSAGTHSICPTLNT